MTGSGVWLICSFSKSLSELNSFVLMWHKLNKLRAGGSFERVTITQLQQRQRTQNHYNQWPCLTEPAGSGTSERVRVHQVRWRLFALLDRGETEHGCPDSIFSMPNKASHCTSSPLLSSWYWKRSHYLTLLRVSQACCGSGFTPRREAFSLSHPLRVAYNPKLTSHGCCRAGWNGDSVT